MSAPKGDDGNPSADAIAVADAAINTNQDEGNADHGNDTMLRNGRLRPMLNRTRRLSAFKRRLSRVRRHAPGAGGRRVDGGEWVL